LLTLARGPRRHGLASVGGAGDHGERVANIHCLALSFHDLAEDAGAVGGDLHVDLLGLQLHHWLALGDLLALALQPAPHRRLDDGLTKLRHFNFRGHLARLTLPALKTNAVSFQTNHVSLKTNPIRFFFFF